MGQGIERNRPEERKAGGAGAQAGGPRIPGGSVPVDYVFLLRPMILIPVWTFFLLGAWHGSKAAGSPLPAPALLFGLAIFSCVVGAAYIVNQISDRSTDRETGKLFLVSPARPGRKRPS